MSHYLYAFGEAASTDCSAASYSSAQAIAATMSLDQSSYADNTQVKVCVRLQSLGGTSTDASDAYEMTWNKSIERASILKIMTLLLVETLVKH